MKKLLVFAMALALVALALPALADSNINGNDAALGNTNGSFNFNNQFWGANLGDQSSGAVNKSDINISDNGSGNVNGSDNSGGALNKSSITVENSFNDVGSGNSASFDDHSGGFLNKSTVEVIASGNFNSLGNTNTTIGVDLTAANSANNNTVYYGTMTEAFRDQYQYTHQFDHQLAFGTAFQSTTDCNFFIPINPVHLSQSNTGIVAGNNAGQVTGVSANAFNASNGSIQGMFGASMNTGGIAQNQAAANVVTAFSAQ